MAKYNSITNDGKCIFCEIAAGRIKPRGDGLFFDDKKYMAWLSPFPNTEGFTVIIPKKHFGSDVLCMPDKDLSEFIIIAKRISKMLMKQFKDVGRVGLIMEGMGVDHAHIKLFPMHDTVHLKKGQWKQYLSGKNDYYDKYPGYIISTDGPQADFVQIAALAKKLRKIKI